MSATVQKPQSNLNSDLAEILASSGIISPETKQKVKLEKVNTGKSLKELLS